MKNLLLVILLFTIVLTSCRKPEPPTPSAGAADFSNTVYVGGSYMAGYSDGALSKKGQESGLSYILAKQIETVGGKQLSLPLLQEGTSIGFTFSDNNFKAAGKMKNVTDCKGETSLFPFYNRLGISQAKTFTVNRIGTYNSYSIPFFHINQLFDPAFGSSTSSNPFYHWQATNPGVSTVASDIASLNSTFAVIWAGMDDIYDYAKRGVHNSQLASTADFNNNLEKLINTFGTSKGVLATIPDIDVFPFFTQVPSLSIELTQNQADSLNQTFPDVFNYVAGINGFQIEDTNLAFPFRLSKPNEYILLNVPLDSVKCHKMGLFYPLPGSYILDENEIAIVKQAIVNYNNIIRAKALSHDLGLVEMDVFFKQLKDGIKQDAILYTNVFVSGNFFSVDGFHPTQKGYSLVANKFIEAINMKYNSTIPTVNCFSCNGVLLP